jgi:hypothetical protein
MGRCNGKCSISEYRKGCRLAPCKAANTQYSRDLRARKANTPVGNVVPIKRGETQATPVSEIGPVERGVIEQIELSPLASKQPGTCQQARVLAKLLDDATKSTHWSRASKELHNLLMALGTPKKKSAGRLHSVSSMSASRRSLRREAN